MRFSITILATAGLVGTTALAQSPVDDFFNLTDSLCLPAIESGNAPDLADFAPFDPNNPERDFLGSSLGDGHVTDDPRLVVIYGETNGFRSCEVSFAGRNLSADDQAISDRLPDWFENLTGQSRYVLIDNCDFAGFKFYLVAGTSVPNPRGHYVRFVAHAGVDFEDEDRYGQPRILIGETPEMSEERCIE
ncbi:MAG: hypothetical protein AAF414_21840 [Pseudomonadota bacterium]